MTCDRDNFAIHQRSICPDLMVDHDDQSIPAPPPVSPLVPSPRDEKHRRRHLRQRSKKTPPVKVPSVMDPSRFISAFDSDEDWPFPFELQENNHQNYNEENFQGREQQPVVVLTPPPADRKLPANRSFRLRRRYASLQNIHSFRDNSKKNLMNDNVTPQQYQEIQQQQQQQHPLTPTGSNSSGTNGRSSLGSTDDSLGFEVIRRCAFSQSQVFQSRLVGTYDMTPSSSKGNNHGSTRHLQTPRPEQQQQQVQCKDDSSTNIISPRSLPRSNSRSRRRLVMTIKAHGKQNFISRSCRTFKTDVLDSPNSIQL